MAFSKRKRQDFCVKVAKAIVEARRDKIAQLLKKHRYLNIGELCVEFGISEATARRDMTVLQGAGKITRMHGGALGEFDTTFASLRERERKHYQEKAAIAEAVHALIQPGLTCFLDAGTSVLAVARHLLSHPVSPLRVVTNSFAVIELLGGVPGMELFVLGGRVLDRQSAIFGRRACRSLRQWHFDLAVLSAQGMDAEGLWNTQPDLVEFQRTVLERSDRACCCLDAGKLGVRTTSLLCDWPHAPVIVSDATMADVKKTGLPLLRIRAHKDIGFYATKALW